MTNIAAIACGLYLALAFPPKVLRYIVRPALATYLPKTLVGDEKAWALGRIGFLLFIQLVFPSKFLTTRLTKQFNAGANA